MAQEGYLKCDLAFAMGGTSSFPDLQDDDLQIQGICKHYTSAKAFASCCKLVL